MKTDSFCLLELIILFLNCSHNSNTIHSRKRNKLIFVGSNQFSLIHLAIYLVGGNQFQEGYLL